MIWKLFIKKKVRSPRQIRLSSQGATYDLDEMFNEVNEQYFESKLSIPITWFGNPNRLAERKRILGSYNSRYHLIKIHRLLDHSHFPKYFVSFVIYHEMLHAIYPPRKGKNGQRAIHHLEFKEMEKKFGFYNQAKAWEKNMRKLGLSYGRPQ